MNDLRVLEFDVLGTNPKNYIRDEKIPLVDKTCPWVIPNGSPFFEADIELYDERGALIPRRLYTLVGDFIPFSETTGKPVWCFIELAEEVRKANAFVTANYRSIGAYFLPRNELEDWLRKIREGVIPVGWEKIFGLPLTYNPSWHIHNVKTEIGDWYELSFFFQALANLRLTRGPGDNQLIDTAVKQASEDLKTLKAQYLKQLTDHDGDYDNPHETDKSHLLLGNRDNFPIGTPQQQAEGKLGNVLSTPRGARLKLQATVPDTEKLMQNGVLPISLMGGGDFIPPAIDGSFEGIGSDNESTGFCLENNGRLMLLTRHYDGRNSALFFSYVDNYKVGQNGNNIVFTGYKYNNAFISGDGVEPDVVIAGSNHKFMMVGRNGTDKWYLCLTNGTFNPASHSYVRVNMTNVNAALFQNNTGSFNRPEQLTAHRMGDYIVLIGSTDRLGRGQNGTQFFFRVKIADILAGRDVSWEKMTLTYTDYDGLTRSNVDYYQMFTEQGAVGKPTSKAGYVLNPPATEWLGLYRKFAAFSAEHPSDKTRNRVHMVAHTFFIYQINGVSTSNGPDLDIVYDLNPATGVMTLVTKTPPCSVDQLGNFTEIATGKLIPNPCPIGPDMTFSTGNCSSVVLPDGTNFSSAGYDSAKAYPRTMWVRKCSTLKTDWDMLGVNLYDMYYNNGYNHYRHFSVIASPLKNNTFPSSLCYASDGEVFTSLNQSDNSRGVFFKRISGPYQRRTEITLTRYPNILSRPLSNDVFKANLPTGCTFMSMTGTAAQLSSAGREMGDFGISVGKWVNNNITIGDQIQGNFGFEQCFPKTFSKVLNQDMTATYTVNSYYGLTNAQLTQLYAQYAPGAIGDKAVSIVMFPAENGPMFSGIAIGIMAFVYYVGNSTEKVRLVSFKATIEAANASHPNVDVIKSFQITGNVEGTNTQALIDKNWNLGIQDGTMVPNLQVYRSGNDLRIYWYTGFQYQVTGNTNVAALHANVDAQSGAITNYNPQSSNWLPDSSNFQAIPNVGISNNNYVGDGSSPSAQTVNGADNNTYLIASTYPSPLWSVFFKEGTRVLINGTKYMLPPGIVDLRDIDPAPANKTFYVYVGVDENGAKYLITKNRMRHNNFLLPAATVVCGEKQVLRIDTRQPFLLAGFIVEASREPGTIPASSGLPMDVGTFRYIYQSDLR